MGGFVSHEIFKDCYNTVWIL